MTVAHTTFTKRLVFAAALAALAASGCGQKKSGQEASPAPVPVAQQVAKPVEVQPQQAAPQTPATVIINANDAIAVPTPASLTMNFGFTGLPATVLAGDVSYECKLATEADFSACNNGTSYKFTQLVNETVYTLTVRGTIVSTRVVLPTASVSFTAKGLAAAAGAVGDGAVQDDSNGLNDAGLQDSADGANGADIGDGSNGGGGGVIVIRREPRRGPRGGNGPRVVGGTAANPGGNGDPRVTGPGRNTNGNVVGNATNSNSGADNRGNGSLGGTNPNNGNDSRDTNDGRGSPTRGGGNW